MGGGARFEVLNNQYCFESNNVLAPLIWFIETHTRSIFLSEDCVKQKNYAAPCHL